MEGERPQAISLDPLDEAVEKGRAVSWEIVATYDLIHTPVKWSSNFTGQGLPQRNIKNMISPRYAGIHLQGRRGRQITPVKYKIKGHLTPVRFSEPTG